MVAKGKRKAIIILDACRYDHFALKDFPNTHALSKLSTIHTNAYATAIESSTSMPKFFSGNPNEERIGFKQKSFTGKLAAKIGEIFPPRVRKKLMVFKPLVSDKKQNLKSSLIEKVDMKTCCVSTCPYYIFGMEKGFNEVHRIYLKKEWQNPKLIVDTALEFLEKNKDNFFVLCHFLQPHAPYTAPLSKIKFTEKDFREIKERLKAGHKLTEQEKKDLKTAYRNNLKWVDKELGPLIKKLKDLGAEIIITSDHGELLGEYNQVEHPPGFKLCEELCHIPLIWYKPKEKPGKENSKIYFHNILRKFLSQDIREPSTSP